MRIAINCFITYPEPYRPAAVSERQRAFLFVEILLAILVLRNNRICTTASRVAMCVAEIGRHVAAAAIFRYVYERAASCLPH